MTKINIYDEIIIAKSIETREHPSIRIQKGTRGTVLELVKNKNGETEYLVELDNAAFDEVVVAYLKPEEIQKIEG